MLQNEILISSVLRRVVENERVSRCNSEPLSVGHSKQKPRIIMDFFKGRHKRTGNKGPATSPPVCFLMI
uniref:Uncharacterized protein n=1 Tax=Anguilla anguilla TaxID=7936 RepID=A0A0E9U0I0_ANGAN